MSINTFWLKVGLFSVGLGQSFAFVLILLARDLGLTEKFKHLQFLLFLQLHGL